MSSKKGQTSVGGSQKGRLYLEGAALSYPSVTLVGPDEINTSVHSHSPLLPGTFSQRKYQVPGISSPKNLKGGTHHKERLM